MRTRDEWVVFNVLDYLFGSCTDPRLRPSLLKCLDPPLLFTFIYLAWQCDGDDVTLLRCCALKQILFLRFYVEFWNGYHHGIASVKRENKYQFAERFLQTRTFRSSWQMFRLQGSIRKLLITFKLRRLEVFAWILVL